MSLKPHLEVYLIRHAQTEYNKLGLVQGSGIDAPINEHGMMEAEAFYAKYKEVKFDAIYCSALQRTQQTIAGFIGPEVPTHIRLELNEISWGDNEGKKMALLDKGHYLEVTEAWRQGELHLPIGQGESPMQVADRQKPVLEEWKELVSETRILVCTHGRAMRILLCQLMQLPLTQMDVFAHQNTGLYILHLDKEMKAEVQLSNDLSHLEGQSEK